MHLIVVGILTIIFMQFNCRKIIQLLLVYSILVHWVIEEIVVDGTYNIYKYIILFVLNMQIHKSYKRKEF